MKAMLLFLFFLSGAAGLSYEIAWTRSLVFVLGNTNLAMGIVLASFLLGFFLGSLSASRWGGGRRDLLRRYALVEVAIGILGFLFPFLASLAKEIYPVLAGWVAPDLIRVLLCALFLLLPTFLMGATFPLMNGIFITRPARATRDAGLIYGAQTLGAAVGATASGFFLIRHFGLAHTSWIIASVNVIVAAIAFFMSLRIDPRDAQGRSVPARDEPRPLLVSKSGMMSESQGLEPILYGIVFCTGFASFALEILWTRILVLFVDGLTYSFTSMLVVYLLALSAGSALLALWDRIRSPGFVSAGLVLIFGGISTVICLSAIPWLYETIQAVKGDLQSYSFVNFVLSAFAGSGMLIFVPAFLIGMATPMAIGILVRESGKACAKSGMVYAYSCLGCCAGALCASWFIVPWIGLKLGVVLAGLVVLTAGVLLFNVSRAYWPFKIVASVGSIVLVGWLAHQPTTQDPLVEDSHVFKRPGRAGAIRLEGYAEGNICTASVVRDLRTQERRLYTDGFSAASTGPEYSYMRMMAHLPVLACATPDRALVIGYGTGTTAGSLSIHTDVRAMDIVEISNKVMELADRFRDVNRGVGFGTLETESADRDVRVYTGMDGRDFLNLSREGYDIITLEPLMPYTPAAVHFYTVEFYELCTRKLNKGGVVCQWIPLNAVPSDDLELLLRTFATVMPSSGFFNFKNSLLLLGFGEKDWTLSAGRMASVFGAKGAGADLEVAGCEDMAALLGAYLCDGKKMTAATRDSGVMRDDRTVVEYVRIAPGAEAYRRMFSGFGLLSRIQEPIGDHLDLDGLGDEAAERLSESVDSYRLSFRYLLKGMQAEAGAAYQNLYPGAGLTDENPDRLFERAFNINPRDQRAAHKHASRLVKQAGGRILLGRFDEARQIADRAAIIAGDLFDLLFVEALLHLASLDFEKCRGSLDMMAAINSHSKKDLALRICLAHFENDEEMVKRATGNLIERGGLSAMEKALVDAAYTEAVRRKSAAGTIDLDGVLALLRTGPRGLNTSGGKAWDEAADAGGALLKEARAVLLDELNAPESGVRLAAAQGLAFFKNDVAVMDSLRRAYIEAGRGDRPALLDALSHAGDGMTYLQVLRSSSASTDLFLKAVEISMAKRNPDAVESLIDLLEHRSKEVRMGAFAALIAITDRRFDFDPCGSVEARARSVEKWRKWHKVGEGSR